MGRFRVSPSTRCVALALATLILLAVAAAGTSAAPPPPKVPIVDWDQAPATLNAAIRDLRDKEVANKLNAGKWELVGSRFEKVEVLDDTELPVFDAGTVVPTSDEQVQHYMHTNGAVVLESTGSQVVSYGFRLVRLRSWEYFTFVNTLRGPGEGVALMRFNGWVGLIMFTPTASSYEMRPSRNEMRGGAQITAEFYGGEHGYLQSVRWRLFDPIAK